METTSKKQKKLTLHTETIRAMRQTQLTAPQLLPTQPPLCTSSHSDRCTRHC
jgi:hypothetical protein